MPPVELRAPSSSPVTHSDMLFFDFSGHALGVSRPDVMKEVIMTWLKRIAAVAALVGLPLVAYAASSACPCGDDCPCNPCPCHSAKQ